MIDKNRCRVCNKVFKGRQQKNRKYCKECKAKYPAPQYRSFKKQSVKNGNG